jgi:hypothetical protein
VGDDNACEPAALAEIEATERRIAGTVIRTPLVHVEIGIACRRAVGSSGRGQARMAGKTP